MLPSVSILIPTFNAEKWIEQAVESALEQGDDKEVIVIDDGSTDSTPEKLRSYSGRIQWERVPNNGAPAARNRLLRAARAPWIQYLDADDYLLPGKIDAQLNALQNSQDSKENQRGADVICGPEIIEWHDTATVHKTVQEISKHHDPWILLALWRLPQTGVPLWRKQALEDVNGWREDQPCCQEHELYLRLLIAGKKFVLSSVSGAVYRRFKDGTVSTSNMARVRAERMKILERLEEHLASENMLTGERIWAINQARFEMARSTWPIDRNEARSIHNTIGSQEFFPKGSSAPLGYRTAYHLLGFDLAERIAALRRDMFKRLRNALKQQ